LIRLLYRLYCFPLLGAQINSTHNTLPLERAAHFQHHRVACTRMKRQSSEAVLEDSNEASLTHHRIQEAEDLVSPVLKRQASSKVSDSPRTATGDTCALTVRVNCNLAQGTSPFPSDPLLLQNEQRADVGLSARKVFTKGESRNDRRSLTSNRPEIEHELPPPPPTANRTGLVFARSRKHFDPSNPLHKEREQRIASVEKALDDARLLGKCRVVAACASSEANGSSSAPMLSSTLVLSEQDFARVHRPAYLKR
jgi:hypothetical protein